MQNRNLLIFLTALITLVCLYYLSFTFVARHIENKAAEYAKDPKTQQVNIFKKQAYLDSVWVEPVFLGYTYKEIKEREVKLGLDLQGGMHVAMEVSAPEVLRVLSGNNQNPDFLKALTEAQAAQQTQSGKFTDLFYEAFKKRSPNAKLSSIFANTTNQKSINFQSTDEQVLRYVDTELEKTIDLSFEVLRTRIDKFGVTSPNIQQLQGTNRIQIELPGVDNPTRVRKLLQGVAKLQFFTVWEPNEFIQYYAQANEYLVQQEKAAKANKAPGSLFEKSDSVAATPAATDSTATALNADTSNDLASQLTKTDTAAKADTTKDLASQGSALTRLLQPTYGGFVANVRDTSKVNALLNREDVKALFPADMAFMWEVKPEVSTDGKELITLYAIRKGRNEKAPLEGDVIVNARQDFGQTGKPEVSMQMNARGGKEWKRLTGQNVGRRIAIVLDNLVYSAPVVQGEIPGGSSSISGNFTVEEAKDLANILTAGKMPVPTRIVEEVVVGPTLGQESINKGLMSIFIGFFTIITFMILYYSTSGIVANIAVLLNILLIMGFLVPLDAVLTLPGIAGIVLTIGMAVDANVLINERIKDELRTGQTVLNATTNGYKAASSSIWDANITTLIAGAVLAYFGSGPIRGFATTLIVGIITSLFTSVYVTRIIIESRLKRNKAFKYTTGFSKDLFKNVKIDFVSKRKIAYVGSSVFLLIGIISMIVRGFNYGVDFKGGWTYVVEFKNEVSTVDVRNALTPYLKGAPEVKSYGGKNSVQITTTYLIDDSSEDAGEKVEQGLKKGFDALKITDYDIVSSAKVGPTVANDIKRSALWAIGIAMLGIFAYIWARFNRWEYAAGTIVALVHDTLVILTVYTLFKDIMPFPLEIDQNFIAAILTIVGFSVNDTVVSCYRGREFLKESGANEDSATVVNKALSDTFSRTIITSATVLFVVLILLIFGGETIRGLSFALLIGVLTGVYSTIYIAVPFLVDTKKSQKPAIATTATTVK